jgi:hypothetical protein
VQQTRRSFHSEWFVASLPLAPRARSLPALSCHHLLSREISTCAPSVPALAALFADIDPARWNILAQLDVRVDQHKQ